MAPRSAGQGAGGIIIGDWTDAATLTGRTEAKVADRGPERAALSPMLPLMPLAGKKTTSACPWVPLGLESPRGRTGT